MPWIDHTRALKRIFALNPARLSLWGFLVLVSAALAVILHWASVPAAMMLGPMLAGVVFALYGAELAVPPWMFSFAQAVVGCTVATSFNPAMLGVLARSWPIMLLAVALVLCFGALAGLGLMRFGSLPGSTAAWGTSPGGAGAMIAMAESYGADVRMVAFMQYLRVILVVVTASLISRLLLGHSVDPPAHAWSPGFDAPLVPLVQTLALAAAGVVLGGLLRIPAGALLLSMIVGALLNAGDMIALTLPPWLRWIAYACLGWYVGLRFTPASVRYALRAVPQLLLSITALMVLCGGAAWLLHALAGVDALSAYLATSPGGLDTVVVIALGSGCDVPFILTLQALRLFAIILTGPFVARLIYRIGGGS